MNLKNKYWYFEKALTKNQCKEIINFGLSKTNIKAVVKDKKLNKIRNSNICWLNEKWLYDLLIPWIDLANKNSGWEFDLNYFEAIQFTIYNKNQHYGWHQDSYIKDDTSDERIRKLSMSVCLSDIKDFKGGEFEFDFIKTDNTKSSNKYICKEIMGQGNIIVFPSFMWHRVKQVTEGTRYSLVMWGNGPKFK